MEFQGKKKGCTKVDDPYFGKRKPSEILKRIHRKISLLESQKDQRELNYARSGNLSSTNFGNNDHSHSSKHGMRKDEPKSRSNENLMMNNAILLQQQRATTAPETLTTTSISNDKWPTKDEFVSLLFRMIWTLRSSD